MFSQILDFNSHVMDNKIRNSVILIVEYLVYPVSSNKYSHNKSSTEK